MILQYDRRRRPQFCSIFGRKGLVKNVLCSFSKWLFKIPKYFFIVDLWAKVCSSARLARCRRRSFVTSFLLIALRRSKAMSHSHSCIMPNSAKYSITLIRSLTTVTFRKIDIHISMTCARSWIRSRKTATPRFLWTMKLDKSKKQTRYSPKTSASLAPKWINHKRCRLPRMPWTQDESLVSLT